MNQLLPILLRHFEDKGNFDVEDLIFAYGDPRQALLLFRVFWPEFVKVGDFVVLKSMIDNQDGPDTLMTLLEQRPEETKQTLSGYRWVEVPYIFNSDGNFNDEEYYILAELMAETWKASLASQFPEQRWKTRVLEPNETSDVLGVSFEEAG
jgi:hypothetical protein